MTEQIKCEIIRDLLPSYVDGLTGAITNQAIEQHLDSCPDCAAILRQMQAPEPEILPDPAPELDYLKKLRRRSSRKAWLIGCLLALFGLSLICFRIFYIGNEAKAEDIFCRVEVSGNTATVSGTPVSSGLAVSRITFSNSNGMVAFKVYTAPVAFFNSGDFNAAYTVPEIDEIDRVSLGQRVIWEDGIVISPVAGKIFAAKNPFVGDAPANTEIAEALGVTEQFGPFTNELLTEEKPYGWRLILEREIAADQEQIAQEMMTADSALMLAAIENLDYVEWQYQTPAGTQTYTATAGEVSGMIGRDIKKWADSAADIQALMSMLNFKLPGMRNILNAESGFRLSVYNDSEAEIYGLRMDYYLNGRLAGSQGGQNADGDPLKKGDSLTFEFTSADLPMEARDISRQVFSFDLYAVDKDGEAHLICEGKPVFVKYPWLYSYTLTGDITDGFTLSEG